MLADRLRRPGEVLRRGQGPPAGARRGRSATGRPTRCSRRCRSSATSRTRHPRTSATSGRPSSTRSRGCRRRWTTPGSTPRRTTATTPRRDSARPTRTRIDAAAAELTSEDDRRGVQRRRPAGQGRLRDAAADRLTGDRVGEPLPAADCRALQVRDYVEPHAPSRLVASKDPGPWLCPRSLPNSARRPSRRPPPPDGNAPR